MSSLNSIPLSAIRAIEAIARTGTLAAAAVELGVTPGALSQRLAKAEAAFGRKLFLRTASGLRPTDLCAEIAPRLTKAVTELSVAIADLQRESRDSLTVSVAPLFASRWLIWRIAKFHDQNPDITLRILPTVEVVDLDRSDVDVGIRVGEHLTVSERAIKLLDQRVFPVCTPSIAREVVSIEDLLKLPVIRENDRLHGWRPWLADRGIVARDIPPGPVYGDASLCLDAAMMGQGVFMAWETIACDALERGQVASPFAQRSLTGVTYWFEARQASMRKASVRTFRQWLVAELACSVAHWSSGAVN